MMSSSGSALIDETESSRWQTRDMEADLLSFNNQWASRCPSSSLFIHSFIPLFDNDVFISHTRPFRLISNVLSNFLSWTVEWNRGHTRLSLSAFRSIRFHTSLSPRWCLRLIDVCISHTSSACFIKNDFIVKPRDACEVKHHNEKKGIHQHICRARYDDCMIEIEVDSEKMKLV